jgi:hypothetical protein
VTGDPPINLPNLYCGVEFWIHHNRIFPFRGVVDLECGILAWDEEDSCRYFDSFNFGRFIAGWRAPFSEGDSVHVWGRFRYDLYTWCTAERPITAVTNMIACPDTNTTVQPITWGRLRALFR